MAHHMTITLSDDEYVAISAEAAKSGRTVEALLHEAVTQRLLAQAGATPPLTQQELQAFLYREGVVENIPTNEPDTPDEEAERQRLAALFGQGKPASEMVIEDRGPR